MLLCVSESITTYSLSKSACTTDHSLRVKAYLTVSYSFSLAYLRMQTCLPLWKVKCTCRRQKAFAQLVQWLVHDHATRCYNSLSVTAALVLDAAVDVAQELHIAGCARGAVLHQMRQEGRLQRISCLQLEPKLLTLPPQPCQLRSRKAVSAVSAESAGGAVGQQASNTERTQVCAS